MSYPARLHDNVPGWVAEGACFHIRIRAARGEFLIECSEKKGRAILEAAQFYHPANAGSAG